jgi:hypothetical protein
MDQEINLMVIELEMLIREKNIQNILDLIDGLRKNQ